MTREQVEILEEYDKRLEGLENDTIGRLNEAIDRAAEDLERQLAQAYKKNKDMDALPQERRRLILERAGKMKNIIDPDKREDIQREIRELKKQSAQLGAEQVEQSVAAIDDGFELEQFAGLNVEAIKTAAQDSYERLRMHGESFANQVSSIVTQSLISGDGPRKLTRKIQQEVGTTKSRAERIARTESSEAYNTAAKQRYKENNIELVRWVAILDKETCPFCIARNGQIYNRDDIQIPAHPHCRCGQVPYKREWAEEGLIDEEFYENYRDRGREVLREQGQEPNFGPTPFEKAGGAEEAPKPAI